MTAMPRFLLLFVALLALSFGLELTPWAQTFVVTPWTDAVARVSGSLMRMFDGTITTRGNVIATTPLPNVTLARRASTAHGSSIVRSYGPYDHSRSR